MTHSINYLLNGASQNNQCQASAGKARCSAGIILGDIICDAMPLSMWLRGARQNARFEALMGHVFAN